MQHWTVSLTGSASFLHYRKSIRVRNLSWKTEWELQTAVRVHCALIQNGKDILEADMLQDGKMKAITWSLLQMLQKQEYTTLS